MTTAYSLSDTLPKDSGGAKFAAWPNIATSQNDFALPLGIGASTIGGTSKIHAYLGVATALAGSPLNNGPAGILNLVAYTTNASSIGTNAFVPQRGDQIGQLYVSALSTVTCAMTGSTETFTTASGTLYRVMCAGCGVAAAAQVAIMNGATSLAHFVFDGNNNTLPVLDLGNHGTCFASLRFERRGTTGTVYITANYNSFFSQ